MHCFVGREGRRSIWGILIADAMILMVIMRWTSEKRNQNHDIRSCPYVHVQVYLASAASMLALLLSQSSAQS